MPGPVRSEAIRVCVRIRPLAKHEAGDEICATQDSDASVEVRIFDIITKTSFLIKTLFFSFLYITSLYSHQLMLRLLIIKFIDSDLLFDVIGFMYLIISFILYIFFLFSRKFLRKLLLSSNFSSTLAL